MPPNGGWRRIKIVAPLTQGREQEIGGGLKNALDRGESLAKAKQSFVNAGYKPEEVEAAVRKMPAATTQPLQQPTATTPNKVETPIVQPGQQQATQPLPTVAATTTTVKPEKELSKKFIIILISSAALALIGAALLGLFWDNLF